MDSRVRTLAFGVILVGLSSLVLLQPFQSSAASRETPRWVAAMSPNTLMPLQNVNATFSSQSSANSTVLNSTTTQPLSPTSLSSYATQNETTAISYLQYQMTSMNDELAAMSSTMSSMNQQAGMNMLIGEAGLIIGILADIAAIAVARRADALYHEATKS